MKTKEALVTYLASGQGDSELMARVMGVTARTVSGRWKNGAMPLGEVLLKLRFVLSCLGFRIDELSELSKDLFPVAEAVALGKVEIERIAQLFDLTVDSTRRVLLGNRETSLDKIDRVTVWYREQEVDALVQEGREEMKKLLGITTEDSASGSVSLTCGDAGHDEFIASAVANLKTLEYFTSRLETEEFSPEERQRFRDQAMGQVMKVANQLFRLCSETARRDMKEGT